MRRCLLLLVSLSVCAPALAVTRTWTGVNSANWSDANNWSPSGVPDASDSIVFGSGARAMNNDLPPWTRIGPISFDPSFAYVIAGNPLILTGPVTGISFARWAVDIKAEVDVVLSGYQFDGTIDVNGHAVTLILLNTKQFNAPLCPINGPIIGTGTLTVDGYSAIFNTASAFSGTVQVKTLCQVAANMPDANFNVVDNGRLIGEGTVGSLSNSGGDIMPGLLATSFNSSFKSFQTKSLSMGGYYVCDVAFASPLADQLKVNGTVNLSGTLEPVVNGSFVIQQPLGREVVIIENDGPNPVNGTFQDLPEGSLISANGLTMRISYRGGDGNDVSLTSIARGKVFTGGCGSEWSFPCNWFPAIAPAPGDLLDVSVESINDLPPGFVVGGLSVNGCCENPGNPIVLTGDVFSGPDGCQLAMPITIGATVHMRCDFLYTIETNGQTVFFDKPTRVAYLNGTGKIPPADLTVDGGTFSGTLSGSLRLGQLPHTSVAGDTHLIGEADSELADVTIEAAGTISPGLYPFSSWPIGTMSVKSLSLAGAYDCNLSAKDADVIVSDGPVTLNGRLNVIIGQDAPTATSYTIIDNRTVAPIVGAFAGLPEGAKVEAGGFTFFVSYRGGDGNDVVLLAEKQATIALTQSVATTTFGEPFTMTAAVTGGGSGVTFVDGRTTLEMVTPINGAAATRLIALGGGTHVISATFGQATATVTHEVKRGTTRMLSALTTPGAGQPYIVKTTLQAIAPAFGAPSGFVAVKIDGVEIGEAPLKDGSGVIASGVLSPGKHVIATHYSGDVNFEPADDLLELTIAPPRMRGVRH
jgi:hypothetical protein